MGPIIVACYGVLWGILTGMTKLTDHPSNKVCGPRHVVLKLSRQPRLRGHRLPPYLAFVGLTEWANNAVYRAWYRGYMGIPRGLTKPTEHPGQTHGEL